MSLVIQMLDPKLLVPHPENSKNHPDEQIDAICSSIKNFGFDQPIVANGQMQIIKGHGRALAALKLGLATVPVIVRDVSANEASLNRVLDNHLTSQQYDSYSLREDLLVLQKMGKLELSLFSESMIPDVQQAVARMEASSFSLITKHKCETCGYRF